MRYYTPSKLSENIHETPEGYLVCVGVRIARTGEMIYGEGETPLETLNGRVIISRSAEQLFRPETIASFEGKACTIRHPTDFVNPRNWSQLAKGVMQNVRRGEGEDSEDLMCDLLITDSTAISLVKNGLREVSCGYEAEYTQTSEGHGEQSNIIGNHLALVEEGRAGAAYAIYDHKTQTEKGTPKMKLSDRIKAIFAKAQDEALKVADEETSKEEKTKKDEAKKDESKDEGGKALDQLVQMVSDMGEKLAALTSSKTEKKDESKKDESKDEDPMAALEARLEKLETSVSTILEKLAEKSDTESDEDEEDLADEDGEEEITEDDDFEESTLTADEMSRAEILSPGINKTKDMKAKALKSAYATADGKQVINSLTASKPDFADQAKVDQLFVAASELLKYKRTSDFSKSKKTKDNSSSDEGSFMTPEKMNEINNKHYNKQ